MEFPTQSNFLLLSPQNNKYSIQTVYKLTFPLGGKTYKYQRPILSVNIEPLRKIGLTEGEIKIYLALINLGETTSGPIINESGVSVSKTYSILQRLAKKGLVSHIVKQNTKYFSAASPGRLLSYFSEKQNELEKQKKSLEEIVSELDTKKGSAITLETAQVFEGLKGIQTARERTLKIMKKGDTMWIIGIARSAYEKLTPYFTHYHKKRITKGIYCNYLYNADAKKPFGERSATYPLSEVKYMPPGNPTDAWIEIYADTVTIGINKDKSFSVIIENQKVADSFREYAKILWKSAKNISSKTKN